MRCRGESSLKHKKGRNRNGGSFGADRDAGMIGDCQGQDGAGSRGGDGTPRDGQGPTIAEEVWRDWAEARNGGLGLNLRCADCRGSGAEGNREGEG